MIPWTFENLHWSMFAWIVLAGIVLYAFAVVMEKWANRE